MTEEELQQHRNERWRVAGNPVRTIEEATDFLDQVGFCSVDPPSSLFLPSLACAAAGTQENLPRSQNSMVDASTERAKEWMKTLLRQKAAYEANYGDLLLISAAAFPFVYALRGPRNPKQPPDAHAGSPLARDLFIALERHGAMNTPKMAEVLGGSLTESALDRALDELARGMRIARAGDASWELLYRWSPEAVNEGARMSVPQASSALISQYLRCTIAVEVGQVEKFLNNFAPISRVREVLRALEAGRELEHVNASGKSLLKLAGEPWPESPELRTSGRMHT